MGRYPENVGLELNEHIILENMKSQYKKCIQSKRSDSDECKRFNRLIRDNNEKKILIKYKNV